MDLSPEKLQEFIELYFKEYGVILSEKQALDEFCRLAELYKIVYREQTVL